MKKQFMFVLFVLLFVAAGKSYGHEVIEVKDGGTLKGIVSLTGNVPEDDVITITSDTEYCGKEQKSGKYIVSDSKVKNVVVWIDDIKKGKAIPKNEVEIAISKCRPTSHVSVGFVGGEYVFRNDDDILHTVQVKLKLAYHKLVSRRPLKDGATIYNLALPRKGFDFRKPINFWHRYSEETGFIQITSNTHPWMRGYIFVFDHPYAAVTDDKGSFVMEEVPAGQYTLKAWHEGFGVQQTTISIEPGKTAEANIAFSN